MISRVANPHVWNTIRWMYIGSGLLFLANISLGIVNVFSPETIPRGQILAHFHAGTIGWITLGTLATAFWVFSGARQVSEGYVRFTQTIAVVGLLAVAGYVMAFGAAFNSGENFWLLPLFGIPTALVIISTMVFIATQFKHQAVVTAPHLMLFGALLVASLGATMGVIWGLSYEIGTNLYPDREGVDGVGAHAAPMEMYLALAYAGFLEMMIRPDGGRWTKPAMAQMVLNIAGAVLAAASLFLGIPQIIPLGLLLFLVGFGFFMVRIGWRVFTINPFRPGRAAAQFFGGLSYAAYVILFVVLVAVFFVPGRPLPHWLGVVFVHNTFIGAGSNLLLATQSTYAQGAGIYRRLEPVAFWILNLGLLSFYAGEYFAGRREGAIVMAIGILLSLFVVWSRLGKAWTADMEPTPADTPPRPM